MKELEGRKMYAWMGIDDEGTFGILMGLIRSPDLLGFILTPLCTTLPTPKLFAWLRKEALVAAQTRIHKDVYLVEFSAPNILEHIYCEEPEEQMT